MNFLRLLVVYLLLLSMLPSAGADIGQSLSSFRLAPRPEAFAVSPDGTIAARINALGDVVVWLWATGESLQTIHADGAKAGALVFRGNDDQLAVGYENGHVILYSGKTGELVRDFNGHVGEISALAFSPDGMRLASGASDGTTQVWSVASGSRLHIFDSVRNSNGKTCGTPRALGFSGDSKTLIVNEGCRSLDENWRTIAFWDLDSGVETEIHKTYMPDSNGVTLAGQSLGNAGWLLAYVGFEGRVMIERLDRCEEARHLPADVYPATLAVDPLGRWVAMASDEGLAFQGLDGKDEVQRYSLPDHPVALIPLPDGRSVIAVRSHETRLKYEVPPAEADDTGIQIVGSLYRVEVPEAFLHKLSMSVVRNAVACPPGEETRELQTFARPDPVPTLGQLARLVPTPGMSGDSADSGGSPKAPAVRDLFFADKGRQLYALYFADRSPGPASAGPQGGVAVWSLLSKQALQVRFGRPQPGSIPLRTRDGWVNVAGGSATDLLTGKILFQGEVPVPVVADAETGDLFREVGGQIQHYAADGRRLADIRPQGSVAGMAARAGRLAVLHRDGRLQLWHFQASGEMKLFRLGFNARGTESMGLTALSADGRHVEVVTRHPDEGVPASHWITSLDSSVATGQSAMLAPFPGQADRAVVNDERANRLAVLDYGTGKLIARLPRQRSRNRDGAEVPLVAALSEDGRLVASASANGLLRIWNIDTHRLVGETYAGDAVSALAFDAEARRIAVGRRDGQILTYGVSDPD